MVVITNVKSVRIYEINTSHTFFHGGTPRIIFNIPTEPYLFKCHRSEKGGS